MPTVVKVRRWGNSLGLRLPRSFVSARAIAEGTNVQIDGLKVVGRCSHRSRYKLKDLLKNYVKPPKHLDFPLMGDEAP